MKRPAPSRTKTRGSRSVRGTPQAKRKPTRETIVSRRSPLDRSIDGQLVTERGSALEQTSDNPKTGRQLERRWLLWVPTVLAVVLKSLAQAGFLAGPDAPAAWVLSAAVVWLTFGMALLGTLALYDDARWLASADADWHPSPWGYVGGGTVFVLALLLAPLALDPGAVLTVPAVAGAALVALPLSSLVAGPIYLAVRYRRLSEPPGSHRSE